MAPEKAVREQLVAALERARERIKSVEEGRTLPLGEQNTKAILIEPVLEALGWNVRDPDEVFREYYREPNDPRVDYALFIEGSPRLFVEAKELRQNLSDRKWISQLLTYATLVGVKWCLLTNGSNYHLYNAYAPVAVEKKLFREVTVSPSEEISQSTVETLELLSKSELERGTIDIIWKTEYIDRRIAEAIYHLVSSQDASLIRWLCQKIGAEFKLTRNEIKESLGRARVSVEFGSPPPLPPSPPSPPPGKCEWKLTEEPDNSYTLEFIFKQDPSYNFTVRGRKPGPDDDSPKAIHGNLYDPPLTIP
ncbi:MAG: type I restriction endonuclease [Candidatus Zipacnadales bacterium]